jgi:hypothetical protein
MRVMVLSGLGQKQDSISKITRAKGLGCGSSRAPLPSERKAPSCNSSTAQASGNTARVQERFTLVFAFFSFHLILVHLVSLENH